MKPKILVIPDVPGWALERAADNVTRRLNHLFEFEKAFNQTAEKKSEKEILTFFTLPTFPR